MNAPNSTSLSIDHYEVAAAEEVIVEEVEEEVVVEEVEEEESGIVALPSQAVIPNFYNIIPNVILDVDEFCSEMLAEDDDQEHVTMKHIWGANGVYEVELVLEGTSLANIICVFEINFFFYDTTLM